VPPTSGLLPIREYILVALTATAVTYLLTGDERRLAIRVGAIANPRARDVHVAPIPRMGGVGIYLGVAAAMGLAHQLPALSHGFDASFDSVGVLLAAGVISLIGALDDRFELDAWTKLAGQVMCAGILVIFGVQWVSFWVPWGGTGGSFGSVLVLDKNQGALLTVVMVVVMVNAMNFVDGLDGLAAGVVLIGSVAFFVFSYQLADANGYTLAITAAMLCAAMGGACAGFLPHNFFPARIFMGDSGSMLLGLVLSGSALALTGQFASISVQSGGAGGGSFAILLPMLLPISILVVPLADLVLAVVRRTRRGQAFYQPDKEHLHHRLLEFGHSQRRAVLVMWLWAGLIAFGAVLIGLYSGGLTWTLLGLGAVVTIALTFLVPRVQRPGEPRIEERVVR
jgi:UDP-GlcNAc:undecaprenyl-phosphate GlcNAc-1-phosphate transferase